MKFAWWKYEGHTRLREVVLGKALEAHRGSWYRAGVRKGPAWVLGGYAEGVVGSDVAEERDRRQEHWNGGWGGPICVAGKGGWISINWGTCDKTGLGGDKPGDLWECGEDGIRESSWKEVGWIFDESQTQMLSGTLRGKRHMRDSYRNKPCWGCGCIRRWEESPTAVESRPWRPWPHSSLTCTRGGYCVPLVSPGSENTYSFRSRNI